MYNTQRTTLCSFFTFATMKLFQWNPNFLKFDELKNKNVPGLYYHYVNTCIDTFLLIYMSPVTLSRNISNTLYTCMIFIRNVPQEKYHMMFLYVSLHPNKYGINQI